MEKPRMLVCVLLLANVARAAQDPAPSKPKEEPKPVASVPLRLCCSDLLLRAVEQTGKDYCKATPAVKIEVSGGGSGASLSAMASGTADLAFTTRATTPEELAKIRSMGFEPMEQILGYDTLAIIVHKDNPIESLSLAQLADMWGDQGPTTKWSQLGVKVSGEDAVSIVCQQSNSIVDQLFSTAVLGQRGNARTGTLTVNGPRNLVALVAKTPTAIGYCPFAYAQDGTVKVVLIAANPDSKPAAPGAADANYPLQRTIYGYFHDEPTGRVKAFAAWLRKPEGQAALKAAGFTPRPRN